MRQPEVARLAAFLLGAVLVLPVARAGCALLLGGAFLAEFLSAGERRPLSALTAPPIRAAFPLPGVAVDRFEPRQLAPARPLVLVHGYAPLGKDEPRAREAATLLARAGFDVLLPTIPGLTVGRLRPDDVRPVLATLAARDGPTILVGVSVGAGPALLAAADPRVRDRVRTVVSLGGYARADELLRFYLTGRYAYGAIRGRATHDPRVVAPFVAANRELVDEPTRRLLASGDPERAQAFLDALPPPLRRMLDALSPELVAGEIRARLVLIHGRDDPAVPYTESLRLAAARPERTTVALVGVVEHVEGGPPPRRGAWRDLLTLWAIVYGLLAES